MLEAPIKGKRMKTFRRTHRKLKVESLEDRCLTASLGTPAFVPTVNSVQPGYELSGSQTPSLTPTDALVRGHDRVSGMRFNHNETLVRPRRRTGRRVRS
jgi:putative extracellular protein